MLMPMAFAPVSIISVNKKKEGGGKLRRKRQGITVTSNKCMNTSWRGYLGYRKGIKIVKQRTICWIAKGGVFPNS
jgi:hypothetical protein